jgi:hypothetical protein
MVRRPSRVSRHHASVTWIAGASLAVGCASGPLSLGSVAVDVDVDGGGVGSDGAADVSVVSLDGAVDATVGDGDAGSDGAADATVDAGGRADAAADGGTADADAGDAECVTSDGGATLTCGCSASMQGVTSCVCTGSPGAGSRLHCGCIQDGGQASCTCEILNEAGMRTDFSTCNQQHSDPVGPP